VSPAFVLKPDFKQVLAAQTFAGGRKIALRAEALSELLCPVGKNGGGALKASTFRTEGLDAAFGWRMTIGANKSYAYFVHQGTKPHEIGPGPKVLHFNWPKAGGYVFFASVHHPGTKPQPWLWQAVNIIIRSRGSMSA
jgi:hypothetical protein